MCTVGISLRFQPPPTTTKLRHKNLWRSGSRDLALSIIGLSVFRSNATCSRGRGVANEDLCRKVGQLGCLIGTGIGMSAWQWEHFRCELSSESSSTVLLFSRMSQGGYYPPHIFTFCRMFVPRINLNCANARSLAIDQSIPFTQWQRRS